MQNENLKHVLLLGDAGALFDDMKEKLAHEYSVCSVSRSEFNGFEPDCRYKAIICSSFVDYGERALLELDSGEWAEWKRDSFDFYRDINRRLVPFMQAPGGSFIVVGSAAALTPMQGESVNGASSAAAFMFLKSMALELGESGIATLGLAVGSLSGVCGVPATDKRYDSYLASGVPQRLDEVSRAVINAVECASMAGTGAVIPLDAGFSCSYTREW